MCSYRPDMFTLMMNCCSWIKRQREPVRKITLVLLGLDNSGKTATLRGILGESTTDTEPTVGFSRADVMKGKYDITIFDVGGGKNIRKIWKSYYADAFGIIFVVDSSDIRRMAEVKRVVAEVVDDPRIAGKPILVLANKQDCKEALRDGEILEYLSLNKVVNKNKCHTHIEQCCAIVGDKIHMDEGVRRGLSWLLSNIVGNYDNLVERVEKDVSERTEAEGAERRERAERVQKIRDERERREKAECSYPEHSSNQEDSDEHDQNRNPFQPISKVINLIEGKIEKRKRKHKEKSTEEYVSDNEAEKELPTTIGMHTGDGIQNLHQVKSDVESADEEQLTEDLQGAKQQKSKLRGLRKFKKKHLRRRNKVEPVEVNDEPDEPIPRLVHGRRVSSKIIRLPRLDVCDESEFEHCNQLLPPLQSRSKLTAGTWVIT
ncbi:ADP-ribosylation factor-like protein 13B [Rhinoraja longicauda]